MAPTAAQLMTALITPFNAQGAIDEKALENLVQLQLDGDVDGIVLFGTTGEGFSLSLEERQRIIKIAQEIVQDKIPLVITATSMDPKLTKAFIQQATDTGIKSVMIAPPPYLKLSQEALVKYYTDLHDSCDRYVILYDNPGRCSVRMSQQTIITLSKLPRCVAYKDSTGDILNPAHLKPHVKETFCLVCGDDPMAAAFLAQGTQGLISITSNIAPAYVKSQITAWRNQDIPTFLKVSQDLFSLYQAMVCESNPVPVKYAAEKLGLCLNYVREPLQICSSQGMQTIDQALKSLGLLNEKTKRYG